MSGRPVHRIGGGAELSHGTRAWSHDQHDDSLPCTLSGKTQKLQNGCRMDNRGRPAAGAIDSETGMLVRLSKKQLGVCSTNFGRCALQHGIPQPMICKRRERFWPPTSRCLHQFTLKGISCTARSAKSQTKGPCRTGPTKR